MARALRIEFPGAFYHVINRGVEQRTIFGDEKDYKYFFALCRRLYPRYKVTFHSYCLMPNHYHLFLQTPRGHLHQFMQDLNSQYSQYYNRRHRRVGPLFQGRYRALLVDTREYALDISRYIHLNPVKAGLVKRPEAYHWSSYAAFLGLRTADTYLHTGLLLSQIGGRDRSNRDLFRKFTMDGFDNSFDPLARVQGGVVIGGEQFLKWLKKEKVPRGQDGAVAKLRELQKPPSEVKEALERRVNTVVNDPKLQRKLLLYGLKRSTTLSLKEISELVGARSPFAVAQVIRRLTLERREDRSLDKLMTRLENDFRSGRS